MIDTAIWIAQFVSMFSVGSFAGSMMWLSDRVRDNYDDRIKSARLKFYDYVTIDVRSIVEKMIPESDEIDGELSAVIATPGNIKLFQEHGFNVVSMDELLSDTGFVESRLALFESHKILINLSDNVSEYYRLDEQYKRLMVNADSIMLYSVASFIMGIAIIIVVRVDFDWVSNHVPDVGILLASVFAAIVLVAPYVFFGLVIRNFRRRLRSYE